MKGRLDSELVGNVSIRVLPTARPDTWEVQGRGELALAVLVELMRREGFELTVGKPQVLTKIIDGKVYEPVERVSLDIPEEHLGTVTQLLGGPQGPHAARGFSRQRLGTHGLARPVPGPDRPALAAADRDQGHRAAPPRPGRLGAVVRRNPHPPKRLARCGPAAGRPLLCALMNLQERGTMFVGPGAEVYEGMIVGENARREDMDVNPTKERKLTNMRSSTAEELVRLTPATRSVAGASARVPAGRRMR